MTNQDIWEDVLTDSTKKWRYIDGADINIYRTSYSSRAEVYLSYGSAGSNYAVVIPYDEDGNLLQPDDSGTVVEAKIRMHSDEVDSLDYDEQVQMLKCSLMNLDTSWDSCIQKMVGGLMRSIL